MTERYIYEVIDLDKDENHNVVYRMVWHEKRNLKLRMKTDTVKQKNGDVK